MEAESPRASDSDACAADEALRAELRQIPLLAPWANFVVHDASLSEALNAYVLRGADVVSRIGAHAARSELRLRVQDAIFSDLAQIFRRLRRQQDARDAAGMLSRRASRTLLENQLVVEAKRSVDAHQIAENVKIAMQAAAATLTAPTMRARRESATSPAPRRRHPKSSVMTQMFIDKRAEETAARLEAAVELAAVALAQEEYARRSAGSSGADASTTEPPVRAPPLLSVQLPAREQTLTQAVQEADAKLLADPRFADEQVVHFRHRPVAQSAISDAGRPVARREPPRERVRYILSTRLGALPPTAAILDEYPIPKEILESLERHRHFHVDEASLATSFEATRAGGGGSWECYVRRSVPVARKPVSFVLASLLVAPERPVPPPRDVFHHHVVEAAADDALLLSEVRQLYDHTHDAYREFRATLHRHLELPYLVDLSFRTSLNSTSYFVDDDVVSSEPSVVIPERLLRAAASSSSTVSKWRVAKSSANRIARRRGAIAVHVQAETSATAQRAELLDQLCAFTAHEVQLMELWYTHDADAAEQPFEPVPMSPALSARFDAVWHELQAPAKERLDLAVKYSAIANSTRLTDAVELWETAAALIREREALLEIARAALAAPTANAAVVAEENAMLRDLATCADALKEILMLTYLEVGDFVTLGGNFYLARMEHEASELRQLIVDSIELMRQRSANGESPVDGGGAARGQ